MTEPPDPQPAIARLDERTRLLEKRTDELAANGGEEEATTEEKAGEKPKKSRKWLAFLILGILMAVVLAVGIPWYLHSQDYEKTDDAFIDGHVVRLDPKVAAYVTAVHCDDNTQVEKGELLVELDARDFEVGLERAQSMLAQARAGVVASGAGVQQAEAQRLQAQAKL